MSKKSENESVKPKEVKPQTEPEKVISEASDLKEPGKVDETENKGAELKKLEEEVAKLKKDKLLLLAEIENKRKDFQQRMEYVYKYGSKILVSQVLEFLVELEEKALREMRNDLEDNRKSEPKNQGKESLLKQSKSANKQTEPVEKLKEVVKHLEEENKQEWFINKFKDHLIGIEMIKNNLKRRLEDEGVKEIEVKVGEDRADRKYHEWIDDVENDNLAEGTIVEVVEKGYFFHEEVIRRVKVKIAKKSNKN